MSDLPPSGTGENAPARHGSIWFNQLAGSLLFTTLRPAAGTKPVLSGVSLMALLPQVLPVAGAGWYDTIDSALKVWNGTSWISTYYQDAFTKPWQPKTETTSHRPKTTCQGQGTNFRPKRRGKKKLRGQGR